MGWAKLDDLYHDHPKMVAVGLVGTGLHARAVTYCARHETDGKIPRRWVDSQLAELKPADRKQVLLDLVGNGVFEPGDNGHYVVHDYLDFNPSHAFLEGKRESDRKRKGGGDGS